MARVRAVLGREGAPHVAALCLILGCAVAMRVGDLFAPMRYDEAFSALNYVFAPLHVGLSNYSSPTNHLLATLLAPLTWRAFADHPWVLRLPALIAGLALVPAVYAAGRLLYDRHAGLV